jgi:hypothetical protein
MRKLMTLGAAVVLPLVLAASAQAASNVTISNAATNNGSFAGASPAVFTPTANNANVSVADLVANLGTGDVVINTIPAGTQNGDITVANGVTWSSGSDLTLNAAGQVLDNDALTGSSGALHATAGGAITQAGAGAISVLNTTLTTTSSAAITLANATNNFFGLKINAGGTVQLNDNGGGVNLASVSAPSTFSLTSSGAITQTGAISIVGDADITASTGSIALTTTTNNFAGAVTPHTTGAGASVSITDANDLTIGSGAQVGATAAFISGGSVTQTGAMTVGGNTNLTLTSPNSDITLSDANDLAGAVTVVANGNVRDLTLKNVNAGASFSGLPASLRNLHLTLGGTGFAFPSMSVLGTSIVDAAGPITQTGAISVPADGFYTTAGGAPITLEDPANQLAGNQRFLVMGGPGNVSVIADGDLGLAAGKTPGNLKTVAGGRITIPAGPLVVVGGSATLVTDADSAAPTIGSGGITIANSSLTSGGPLAIYTARRSENSINSAATLNSATFTPGTEFVDTAREVWNTRFPDGTASNPFTIFYKEAAPPVEPTPTPPAEPTPIVPAVPNTSIDTAPKAKIRTDKRRVDVSFEFSSDVAGATFRCALDGKHTACTSPFTARVKKSRHHFEVVATANGLTDPTPAEMNFKVLRRHRGVGAP